MKNNKILIWLLVIIAVIAIIGVVYFIGKNSNPASVFVPSSTPPVAMNPDQNTTPAVDQNKNTEQDTNKQASSGCTSTSVPSITVLSPSGREVFTAGQQVAITWTSCNVQNVYISMAQGGHDMGNLTQTNIPASQGSYQWTVPSAAHWPSNSGLFIGVWGADSAHPDVAGKSGLFTINTSVGNDQSSSSQLNHLTVNSVSIPYPSTWKVQNPDSSSCSNSHGESCMTTLGQRGFLSYKIYNPSLTTGDKAYDEDAIYISPKNCSSSFYPCPDVTSSNIYPNSQKYDVGTCMTILTSGKNSLVTNIFNQIKNQVSSSSDTSRGCKS